MTNSQSFEFRRPRSMHAGSMMEKVIACFGGCLFRTNALHAPLEEFLQKEDDQTYYLKVNIRIIVFKRKK